MRIVALFVTLTLLVGTLKAQENPNGILAASHLTVPPAPNVAALGKFGDIPVSYYTGTPNITVPIYELKSKALSVPIALSYHASGIKVEEVASWVGIGWALNAGGSISRSVRGGDDFVSRGYQSNPHSYSEISGNPQLMNSVVNGTIDAQPDLFYYSFPGGSGKFLPTGPCTSNIGNCTFFSIPLSGTKFEQYYSGVNLLWRITTMEGTQYVFGKDGVYGEIDFTTSYRDDRTDANISAWHLAKIIAPNKSDSIMFQYEIENLQYEQGLSMVSYERIPGTADPQGTCTIQTPPNQSTSTSMDVRQCRVSKIISSTVTIEFIENSSLREDLYGGHALDSIKIITGTGSKAFKFQQSYFVNQSTKRLKLDQVSEIGTNRQVQNPFIFTYNENQLLPASNMAQDHWGFTNGNTGSLIPRFLNHLSSEVFTYYPAGGDREPDSLKTLAGILTRITYPTGGFTQFNFEAHDYSMIGGVDAHDHDIENVHVIRNAFESDPPKIFTITTPTTARIQATVGCTINRTPDPPHASVGFNGYSLHLAAGGGETGANSEDVYMTLSPGTYQTSIDSWILGSQQAGFQVLCDAEMTITLYRPKLAKRRIAGGVRIASIINDDGTGNHTKKAFEYKLQNGNSSGVLVSEPVYTGTYGKLVSHYIQGDLVYSDCYYTTYASMSKATLGSTQGSHIGYKEVKVKTIGAVDNGSTVYKYTAADEYGDFIMLNFPFLNGSRDFKRGLLLSEENFNAGGQSVKSSSNTYNFNIRNVSQFALGVSVAVYFQSNIIEANGYTSETFYDGANWVDKIETTETVKNLGISSITKQNFYYTNPQHKLSDRQTTTTSAGDQIVTRSKFAQDVTASGIYTAMISKNMTGVPVENQTWKKLLSGDSVLLSASKTEFLQSGQCIFPMKEKSYSIITPVSSTYFNAHPERFEDLAQIDLRDSYGNVIQYTPGSGVVTSLVWGYNNQMLIAEVKGATSNQIFYEDFEDSDGNTSSDKKTGRKSRTGGFMKTLPSVPAGTYVLSFWKKISGAWSLTSSEIVIGITGSYTIDLSGIPQIDDVRFCPKGAMMGTYTFDPGIGATSVTDHNNLITYYEYDNFWRLKAIRDHNNNILKTFRYNYKTSGYVQ